jgi:hypothetical protein
MLLVTNATCDPGPCDALSIRGYGSPFTFPQPEGGTVMIGSVNAASACLTFPPSVTAMGLTWTPADAIEVTALDATVGYRYGGQTTEFTPASAPGWSVTFPTSGVTAAVPGTKACTP